MWERHAAFWRDFSKLVWESTLFVDFHTSVIFHQTRAFSNHFYPQIPLKTHKKKHLHGTFSKMKRII